MFNSFVEPAHLSNMNMANINKYHISTDKEPVPTKDQFDSVVPVTRDTWQRVIDFQKTHPSVDIRPLINERVNDLLDEAQRAENG